MKSLRAFTLIELLVVITIIAILASIAAPVFNSVQRKAQQTKALSNAKQIGLACKLYALDEDGNFPAGAGNSSDTFNNQLIAGGYMPNEEIFFVQGEYYSGGKLLLTKDGALAAAENGWGYNPGMADTDYPQNALIFTRPASATAFVEAGNLTTPGGVWDGRVIVVNIDYSGTVERVVSGDVQRGHGDTTQESILGIGGTAAELPE
jgi:prepilin-type N-terminal cleavage/methylation domain-containing protein